MARSISMACIRKIIIKQLRRKTKHLLYQVVIGSDPKELSEVAEGHGGVGFEPEVRVVMCWGQVAALTAETRGTGLEGDPSEGRHRETHSISDTHLGKKMLSTT